MQTEIELKLVMRIEMLWMSFEFATLLMKNYFVYSLVSYAHEQQITIYSANLFAEFLYILAEFFQILDVNTKNLMNRWCQKL